MQNRVKRVAAIHDISGFGRASLTAIIPTLSAMGIQVCPVPTAILSNHTVGFPDYSYVDLTDTLEDFINHWKKLEIPFDGLYSGFLGSPRQMAIVSDFFDSFKKDDNLIVVDPVMGDGGKLYSAFTTEIIPRMQELIKKADLITPNYTEAAFLLGEAPDEASFDMKKAKDWLKRLAEFGPEMTVITSAPLTEHPGEVSVVAYDKKQDVFWKIARTRIPASYPGTGDTFTAVLLGALLEGDPLPVALDRAGEFISQCIKASYSSDEPVRNGVLLEKELPLLRGTPSIGNYEKF